MVGCLPSPAERRRRWSLFQLPPLPSFRWGRPQVAAFTMGQAGMPILLLPRSLSPFLPCYLATLNNVTGRDACPTSSPLPFSLSPLLPCYPEQRDRQECLSYRSSLSPAERRRRLYLSLLPLLRRSIVLSRL